MNGERRDKGAHFLLVAASLIVVVAGLRAAAGLITPLLVAVFLALVSLPLLNWMMSRKIPRPLAVLATLLAAFSVLALLVWVISDSIRDLTREAPKYKARLTEMTDGILAWLQAHGLDLSGQLDFDLLNPARALDIVTGTLGTVTAVLSNTLLVFLTITFILLEAASFSDKLAAAFPRQRGTERFKRIRREVQRYLSIKSVLSLTTGILIGAAMKLLEVDFPVLWGVLAFLLNYIPNLGSMLAAIPPVLLATVQLGIGRAILVAIVFGVVNVVMGTFIEPHLMGRQLGLSTLVVFLSLVFWGWVWGPIGMLLSVPLTVILKIMLENTEDFRWIAVLLGGGVTSRPAAAGE